MLEPIKQALFGLLSFFNDFTGSYGLAIILLTLSIRTLMLPLTIKQTRSMKQMQKVQPKLKELQEKHKGDREKLQKEMMAFYSANKINPLGGCLPLLLQFPILIAIYQVLVDKKLTGPIGNEGFLWVSNLTTPDVPLIVLMILTTFFSMITSSTDPQQTKTMLPMTLLIGVIAINLPAGVLLYWVSSNLFSTIQQIMQLGPPTFFTKLLTKEPPASTEKKIGGKGGKS